MKFINKRYHGNGWYLVKPVVDGIKYEVIVYDGVNTYYEDIRCASLSEAYEYAKDRINAV